MTSLHDIPAIAYSADYKVLAQKYRPIFDQIAAGALQREKERILPFEPIQWLKQAGFGAVRIPVEQGGDGASIPQLFQLLIELSKADSNVTQALRGHFAFVEDRLNAQRDADQSHWFKRFVAGEIVGNAWTEIGNVKIGDVITKVTKQGEQWIVNGKKYYTTGSIFADWFDLFAQIEETGESVIAATRTQQQGVTIDDDWDGFGQRTTGSGTAVLVNAEVEEVIPFDSRFKYQTAFYQLFHLSTLTGIAQAAVAEFTQQVRQRTRVFSHGNGDRVDQDVQVLQVIGKASAQAYAAEAITIQAAQASQRAFQAHFSQDEDAEKQINILAEIESAQGQVVIADLVLDLTSKLFNALSASAASRDKALDRFWRNARTVSSHNPLIYKEKSIGDWEVNGTEPIYAWQIGGGSKENG
ncbi:MAG: acyl-CoA dehydrogenase family protein [Acinetobacter populi]|jgi:alkylation response protein AidB-like acyl-CoA dehydrogenase|uniref:acyl-CoA dehydrogenase family protein n=1 Tax=Acinetobacter populi TaxID=1582270 RepID=UPI002354377D|nr:acyl-CoA dehydrogenase family protein [Acinetobacter populi]MCH4249063.1 acyl-CoA dehydrogenase family protein [Acinetobacter populi]